MTVTDHSCFFCGEPADVEKNVGRQLSRHGLLNGVKRLGLAVSGGADSVALFHLLLPVCKAEGIDVTVLHLNHGLRAEAEEDERFVQALAQRLGVPFLGERISVSEQLTGGTSLEMAARAARMDFFARSCATAHLDAVATGHQADDVAESVLLRLARGAGASGLSGLRPRFRSRTLSLIRPLLTISGAALRTWLRQRALPWREDVSNRDSTIPRNRVRHEVLPLLENARMPDLRARLCQSAELLREDDSLLETLAAQSTGCFDAGDSVAVPVLLQQPEALQRRMLRQWLFRQGQPEASGFETVLALLRHCHSSGNWRLQLPGGVSAVCTNRSLRLEEAAPPPSLSETALRPEGDHRWGTLEISTLVGQGITSEAHGIGVYPAACAVSAERLKGKELRVRTRQPGDRIAPTGLDGSKKIHDLFVDAKIPEPLRDTIPIFTCGEEVVWIPGYRVSRHFAVPSPEAASVQITVRLK